MFNDAIDDQPQSAAAAGFQGMDCNTNPTLLEPGIVADGKNMWCRGDGNIETRPGLKVNATALRAHLLQYGSANPDLIVYCAAYYDTPTYEATVYFTTNGAWAITGSGDDLTATYITTAPLYTTARQGSDIVQLVDRLYYLDTFGRINWLLYTAGTWTAGTLTTFSAAAPSSGASMPVWSRLVAQGFRLMAFESTGYKLYASAIGTAYNAADWVVTENIQVGNGEGDPAKAVVATQGGYITVLNTRSAYQVATSAATVAAWSSLQVSRQIGCVEGRTAVVLGQDVFFLSRIGVVNLGALADSMSIAPQDTLSYPIQPYIDRINWSAIGNAFATTWDNLYLIALPLDSETLPTHLFAYHLKLKRWMAPWVYRAQAISEWPGYTAPRTWTGLRQAVVTHFADKVETLLVDSHGQFLRIDPTAETDQTTANVGAAPTSYALVFATTQIPSYLRTRSFTHDQPASRKQPFYVETDFADASVGASIDTLLLVDGQATVTTTPGTGTVGRIASFYAAGDPVKKRYLLRGQFDGRTLAPYREAAVEIFCDYTKMSVRSVVLSAFVDPPFFTA